MSDGAPFEVGQRVRVTKAERSFYRFAKSYAGVVVGLENVPFDDGSPFWLVRVRRDGIKTRRWFCAFRWEVVPLGDLTLHETCEQLVAAYHAGDTSAALGLAERVFELCGGTKREGA